MTTQRVNAYKNSDMTVFYIEEFNPELKEWFTVGDTYENIKHASAVVENHNLQQLNDQLFGKQA